MLMSSLNKMIKRNETTWIFNFEKYAEINFDSERVTQSRTVNQSKLFFS